MDVPQQVQQLIAIEDIIDMKDPPAGIEIGILVLESDGATWSRFFVLIFGLDLSFWAMRVVTALRARTEHR